MINSEHSNWIINIENTATTVSTQVGPAVVGSVFMRYGSYNIVDLNPRDLSDAFSGLYAIEADLK